MRLNVIKYTENQGTAQEWALDGFQLGPRTLVVGRNASGKSRTLKVIANLARYLAGLSSPAMSGSYDCAFEEGGLAYHYKLSFCAREVTFEELTVGGEIRLTRADGGVGRIWAEKIDQGSLIDFQTPPRDIAAVVRRDALQHSFLEPLYKWASSLRYYRFGTSLGQETLVVAKSISAKVDERDQDTVVVKIFWEAKRQFGEQFSNSLISDLKEVGYDVEEVGLGVPISIGMESSKPIGDAIALFVKEKDLPGITDQLNMSQGMFRVLSLLVHVNYFQLSNSATCVLVDDIGEGLDFERSCSLIKLLRSKAAHSNLQIVLSTNDKFVMNEVPLEEWSVIQRDRNHIFVRNYDNSREIFDEFRFTGLSNFSFFEMDVINEQREESSQNA